MCPILFSAIHGCLGRSRLASHLVARFFNSLREPATVNQAGQVDHVRLPCGRVHGGRYHPSCPLQRLLDSNHAGSAVHALDSKLRGCDSYSIPSRTDAGSDGFDIGLCRVKRDTYQVGLRVGSRVLYAWQVDELLFQVSSPVTTVPIGDWNFNPS